MNAFNYFIIGLAILILLKSLIFTSVMVVPIRRRSILASLKVGGGLRQCSQIADRAARVSGARLAILLNANPKFFL